MRLDLLIVGADALDIRWTNEFMDVMPNLAEIRRVGAYGMLRSWEFPSTPPCWFSALTGCTPEEHRIQGFRKKAMQDLRRPPFWRWLDVPVGVVNVPLVYAEERMKGFLVPGFHAPFRCWPTDLEVPSEYVVDGGQQEDGRLSWLDKSKDSMVPDERKRQQIAFLRLHRQVDECHVTVALRLAERFKVRVLFVGLMIADRIGHGFAHHHWTMKDTYRMVDEQLGRLVEGTNPRNVVVFSDHGMDLSTSPRLSKATLDDMESKRRHHPLGVVPVGLHTRFGILALMGPHVRKGELLPKDATLADVAPTFFRAIGVDVPKSMSGKALDVFKTDEEMMDELLRGLGYL